MNGRLFIKFFAMIISFKVRHDECVPLLIAAVIMKIRGRCKSTVLCNTLGEVYYFFTKGWIAYIRNSVCLLYSYLDALSDLEVP